MEKSHGLDHVGATGDGDKSRSAVGQEVTGRGGSGANMRGWQRVGGQQLEEDSGHGL